MKFPESEGVLNTMISTFKEMKKIYPRTLLCFIEMGRWLAVIRVTSSFCKVEMEGGDTC